MIELYIGDRRIDIKDDLEINFTYESIDGEKLSAIKNSFSKTVNIPGTANNNMAFGYIFRFDKYISVNTDLTMGEGYDPHKRVPWFINRNGAVVNRGYCTLDNIIMKDEREITYQLTLYGGIGEFFYSLAYNEDGTPKTLYDMFWNWRPRLSLFGSGSATAMSESEEDTGTIYNCSSEIVASAYHELNPLYGATGTTDVYKDVVFVPCYTGLYENFDSKHMIVSTFNQNYNPGAAYLPQGTIDKLRAAFPDSYTEDGKAYTTLDKEFSPSGAYRYGLATFSRDVDAWEAGDLRVSELPVAIRLAKLMTVISQPQNNGGYEVEWDDEITNSWHWLYGWVMLGKVKQDKEKLSISSISPSQQYDGQRTTINVDISDGSATAIGNAVPYDIPSSVTQVPSGNYLININVLPQLTFKKVGDGFGTNCISGSFHYGNNENFRYVWTTSVLVHKIYDGNTLIKSIADIFYFSGDTDEYYYGYNFSGVPVNDLKSVLNGKVNERFMGAGEFIDEYRYHICKLENPTVTGEGYIKTFEFTCGNELITTRLSTSSGISDLRVEQSQGMMWTNLDGNGITAGKYGTDAIAFNNILTYKDESPYGFVTTNYEWKRTFWQYNNYSMSPTQNYSWASFKINAARQNGVLTTKESGYNILKLNKKTLFANSQSPMKYLSDYCKMMNYRFICDNAQKKIQIKTLKNYYIDRTIDLGGRVDVGRDISIGIVTAPSKVISIGAKTPETYPVQLFNRISREKFNTTRYDTGIKYNASETSLLDNLVYENTIDWQQASVYYTNNPQFPKPYNVQSISWTLFGLDSQNVETIEKKEIYTPGTPSDDASLLESPDFMPKVALFDKSNKTVDFDSSLIFLNGFVKNYDYTEITKENYVISPRVCLSNDMYEMYYFNQERCYVYGFKYNDTFTNWGCYSTEQKGVAASWVLPFFTRDLYNGFQLDFQEWQPAAYKLASWNIANRDGLDTLYSLSNTTFVANPNYSYSKTLANQSYLSNEYAIEEIPPDIQGESRIYDAQWENYLNDLYDRNNRDVTAYVDLSGLGDANDIMRNFYSWKSHIWVITRIENFKVANTVTDKFTKVKLHKIKDKATWTN